MCVCVIEKLILKLKWKSKDLRIFKMFLKNNKLGGFVLLDIKN